MLDSSLKLPKRFQSLPAPAEAGAGPPPSGGLRTFENLCFFQGSLHIFALNPLSFIMNLLSYSSSIPRRPKMAPRPPKTAPRWPQDGPCWPQEGSKTAEDGPKTHPRWPKTNPKTFKINDWLQHVKGTRTPITTRKRNRSWFVLFTC